jgi:hypothetical protein
MVGLCKCGSLRDGKTIPEAIRRKSSTCCLPAPFRLMRAKGAAGDLSKDDRRVDEELLGPSSNTEVRWRLLL